MDNFITVWDGKPIEAFLHPIDAYKGLKAKYLVFKADTGEMVDNCFILRPDKDAVAVEALRAYAKVTDNETLAKDIYNWVGNGVTVQEWISVKDRLPEERDSIFKKMYGTKQWLPGMFCTVSDNVIVSIEREDGTRCVRYMHTQGGEWNLDSMPWAKKVTHWMPLPKPPKGE